jgi:hypothetical protein
MNRLTELLQRHRAYESASRIGVEYADSDPVTDHFRQGMFIMKFEKSHQFGVETTNDDGENIEDTNQNTADLELDDISNI